MFQLQRYKKYLRLPNFLYTFSYPELRLIELKLSKNGGVKAAKNQIITNQYLQPFKADKRKVVGLAIELDDLGKGLLDWDVIE